MEFSSRAENTSFRTELVERRTSFPALLLLKKKKKKKKKYGKEIWKELILESFLKLEFCVKS